MLTLFPHKALLLATALLASSLASAWNGYPLQPVRYGHSQYGYGYPAPPRYGQRAYRRPAAYQPAPVSRAVTPIMKSTVTKPETPSATRPAAATGAPAALAKAPATVVKPSLADPVRGQLSDELIDLLDYPLGEDFPVPRVQMSELPSDYYGIQDSEARKQTFFRILLPVVLLENERLLRLRGRLQSIYAGLQQNDPLTASDAAWLKKLARKYRVQGSPLESATVRTTLLQHVDVIPASLALAQAANESAWGKSRFAREALNLFGIWTYDESKGIVPKHREAGKKHLVRKFDNLRDGVQVYMQTLNSHPAYQKLREIRAARRAGGQAPDGAAMAEGLEAYSGIGDRYIRILQDIIHDNQLADLDRSSLSRG